MKTGNILKKIILPAILLSLAACVPQKKFEMVQAELRDCNSRYQTLQSDHERLTQDHNMLKDKLAALENERKQLKEDYSLLMNDHNSLKQKQSELQKQLDALKSGSEKEIGRILTELQTTQDSLQMREDRLAVLERDMNEKQDKLAALQNELALKEKKLNELQKILDDKEAAVRALRKSVEDALLGFQGKGLSVDVRNGKVYVSLEENLLFATGKWDVGASGKEALKKLAKVLEENPDINVLVEGHTDNVPLIGPNQIKDNWDLSVMRATSIVKILVSSANIDPRRLTAAGRSEYLPVDPANTSEARRKNRRTEIILTPKLDELFRIIESN